MATTYLGIGWGFIHFNFLVFALLLSMLGFCFGMFTMISNAGIYNSIQNDNYMSAATVINSSIIPTYKRICDFLGWNSSSNFFRN